MSLGYTLLANDLNRLCAIQGLDSAYGFLHSSTQNRQALSLDLIERLRTHVDQWVFQLLHAKHLEKDQFTISDQEGCRMNKDARQIFYFQWLNDYEQSIQPYIRNVMSLISRQFRLYDN